VTAVLKSVPPRKLILFLFLIASVVRATPVAIVVSPDVPVDDLSFAELRKVFLGERQFWNSNLRVVLLMRAPVSPERDAVLRSIYQMNEAQFRQYWISKVFRADVSAGPKIVYSTEMANELVSAIPGAVAFVDSAQIPKGLKVLKIDGKMPGDKSYPLK
jgi:ABC-type phosphate transport system substrate-binding protein